MSNKYKLQISRQPRAPKQTAPMYLSNIATGEIWLCDDYFTIRVIDDVEFIFVYKETTPQRGWIKKNALTKMDSVFAKP